MKILEILVITSFLLISIVFLGYGLIYQKQSSRIEKDLQIYLPTSIKVLLKVWVLLELLALLVSILALIISVILLLSPS